MNWNKWKEKTYRLKSETYALYLAMKDPRVPRLTMIWIALVVGYALSPIDIIPDFIPVIGYLDDIMILPVCIMLIIKTIPQDVMDDCRKKSADQLKDKKMVNWIAGSIILLIWLVLLFYVIFMVWRIFRSRQ